MMEKHVWKHQGGLMYVDKKDQRYDDYKKVQKETGVSPDETWNLDTTIAMFILPRIRMFKQQTIGVPCDFKSMDEWHAELDKMIVAFELLSGEECIDDRQEKIDKGLDAFRKYFQALWW